MVRYTGNRTNVSPEHEEHSGEVRMERASASGGGLSTGAVTIIGAVVALASASVTALIGGYWQLEAERSKQFANLSRLQQEQQFQILIRATEGVEPEEAARNLKFFVDIGYLQDPTGQIRKYAEKGEPPIIPSVGRVEYQQMPVPTVDFERKAPVVMNRLMRDFDISDMQAAAILGNIGHETNGFQILIERAPVAGRGGIGWGLWTGPRRRAFEEFARQSGLDILSDEANYGFLTHELRTAEKQAVARLKGESTLPDAVRIFELSFLRAPFKRYASREKWAQRALDSYSASTRGTVAEEDNGALPPASPAPSSP